MSQIGSAELPLRVAIIGSGPTGFYAADRLLKQCEHVGIDLFDRLATPFGLVRGGVAPDHQKIKTVTKAFHRTADNEKVRFFGNVEIGKHVSIEELKDHYHFIILSTGAQTDRNLGIEGEQLDGSHSATQFVAWYNGHPDFRELTFDLSQERVAIIGVGNVAVDVARILSRTPDELAKTDIAEYALDALSRSKVKEIVLLGRRGPLQSAFTNPEIKELGELEGVDVRTLPDEVRLDALSKKLFDEASDKLLQKKLEILKSYAEERELTKARLLTLRFLVSPLSIHGDDNGRVCRMTLGKNRLFRDDKGSLRAQPTGETEELETGLVFRSVGYRGVAIPGIPFNDAWGIIPNTNGRVENTDGGTVEGVYTAGWIKRGPSGVIGTNKPCAVETVDGLLEDLQADKRLNPSHRDPEAIENLLRERQPDLFTYEDWLQLDAKEIEIGQKLGRPRVKFTSVEQMLDALGRSSD